MKLPADSGRAEERWELIRQVRFGAILHPMISKEFMMMQETELSEVMLGGEGGIKALQVRNAFCSALISRQGAQLLAYQAHGRPPLLWLSERAIYRNGKAIRGGIPLCFPWFGAHPQDASKPAHGFARVRDWHFDGMASGAAGNELYFSLRQDEATQQLWPHLFRLELRLTLGASLQLELDVHNSGEDAFTYSFALHSYFPVIDIADAEVRGLDGSVCTDQLAPATQPVPQRGTVRFAGETDRIFNAATGHYLLVDRRQGREIVIRAGSCASAVVWNPWQDKAARLADMDPSAWRHMVCVECGQIGREAVTLQPGAVARHSLYLDSHEPG